MFINRKQELNFFESLASEKKAQFIIVYGRRRIGKTELLKHFSKNKKHLFFLSDLSSEQEQLRQFTEKISQIKNESFIINQPFSSWEALFHYIIDHVISETNIIIIDEFPYLCAENKALPSIIQKIWDEKGKNSSIFLILCGSYMSFMEKEVLGSKSPLYGRRTGQMLLQAMSFQDISLFFPNYSMKEKIYIYAILGGTPAYLLRFSDTKSIEQNVKDEILNKNAFLYAEPRFLLMEELREPSLYFAILKAISFGKTKLNEIVQETGINDRNKVNKYITSLRELQIVKREIPITEEKPHKSRKGIYVLQDEFFRFWFRFIFPNLSFLEEGDISYVWEEKILKNIDSFAGPVYEKICIEWLKKLNKENKLPFKALHIGRWWEKSDEIDIVAFDDNGSYLFCECKCKTKKVGMNVLDDLQKKADKSFSKAKHSYFALFSRSKFEKKLIELSKKNDKLFLYDY